MEGSSLLWLVLVKEAIGGNIKASLRAAVVAQAGFKSRLIQLRIAVNLLSLGAGLFILTCKRMVHTIPINIYHYKIYEM